MIGLLVFNESIQLRVVLGHEFVAHLSSPVQREHVLGSLDHLAPVVVLDHPEEVAGERVDDW